MIWTLLALLAAALVAFLVYVARQPAAFRIARSVTIRAAPDQIFPFIDDLRRFNSWNPYLKADPEAKLDYSGAARGSGAAYTWNGKKSGSGRLEITETKPAALMRADLQFTKPFAANNIAEFTLTPNGDTTTVTWAMSGQRPFSHKLMGTLFSMDKMVGGEFAKGLSTLKDIIEAEHG